MGKHIRESFDTFFEDYADQKEVIARALAVGEILTKRQRKLLLDVERCARREDKPVPEEIIAAQKTMVDNMLAVRRAGGTIDGDADKIVRHFFNKDRAELQKAAADARRETAREGRRLSAERRAAKAQLTETVEVEPNPPAFDFTVPSPQAEAEVEFLNRPARVIRQGAIATKDSSVRSGQALVDALEGHAGNTIFGSASCEAARQVADMIKGNPVLGTHEPLMILTLQIG